MKRKLALLAGGLILTFIVGGCGFFVPSTQDIVNNIIAAQSNINTLYAVWQETNTTPGGNDRTVAVHYWYQNPASFRYSLEEKGSPAVLTVCNGNLLWKYSVGGNSYTVAPLSAPVSPDPFSIPFDLSTRLGTLLSKNQVNYLGTGTVADRPAYGLQLTASNGVASILWVDQNNYQPLSYLTSTPDGTTTELKYQAFQPNISLDSNLFRFSPPSGVHLSFDPSRETAPQEISLQDAANNSSFPFIPLTAPLPDGITITKLTRLPDLQGGTGAITTYLQDNTDQTILVTESPGPAPGAQGPWADLFTGTVSGQPYHILPGPDKSSAVILSFLKGTTLVIIYGAAQAEAINLANNMNSQ